MQDMTCFQSCLLMWGRLNAGCPTSMAGSFKQQQQQQQARQFRATTSAKPPAKARRPLAPPTTHT